MKDKLINEKPSNDSFKPEICQKSRKIVQNLQEQGNESGPVHQRLYKPRKNNLQKQAQTILENDNTNEIFFISPNKQIPKSTKNQFSSQEEPKFRPTIQQKSKNIIRDEKIENILYEDAKRRLEKSSQQQQSEFEQQKNFSISKNSVKFVIQKFLKELNIRISEIIGNSNEDISFWQIIDLYKSLGFIKGLNNRQQELSQEEQTLLVKLFSQLSGSSDIEVKISQKSLIIFTLGILGLHIEVTSIQNQKEENENQQQEYNSINKKYIHETNIRQIQKEYELFYYNRISREEDSKRMNNNNNEKTVQSQNGEFKPEISDISKNLAIQHRERLLESFAPLFQEEMKNQQDQKISLVNLLNIQKKLQEENIQRLQEEKITEELRECTFKPKTLEYKYKKNDRQIMNQNYIKTENEYGTIDEGNDKDIIYSRKSMSIKLNCSDRNLELYSLAKTKQQKKDKSKDEIEYEKNCDECTFAPDLTNTKPKKYQANGSQQYVSKDIDKTVERMQKARQQREYINKMKERGYPFQAKDVQAVSFNLGIEKNKFKSSFSPNNQTYNKKSGQSTNKKSKTLSTNKSKESFGNNHLNSSEQGLINEQEEFQQNQYQDKEDLENNGDVPLLFVDVNLGQGRIERIVVHQGDQSEELALKFVEFHGLDISMTKKLKELLDNQISNLLQRIDEEEASSNQSQEEEGYDDELQQEEDDEQQQDYE